MSHPRKSNVNPDTSQNASRHDQDLKDEKNPQSNVIASDNVEEKPVSEDRPSPKNTQQIMQTIFPKTSVSVLENILMESDTNENEVTPQPTEQLQPVLPKNLVRNYFDFDGTLTHMTGRILFESDFYESLLEDPAALGSDDATFNNHARDLIKAKIQHEKEEEAKMQPKEEVTEKKETEEQAKIRRENYIGLSDEALKAIKEKLAAKEEIIIVSKNYEEYIKYVMLESGITPSELNSIKIIDRKQLAKYDYLPGPAVEQHEIKAKEAGKQADYVYIVNDNKMESIAMKNGAENAKKQLLSSTQIKAIGIELGEFPKEFSKDISESGRPKMR